MASCDPNGGVHAGVDHVQDALHAQVPSSLLLLWT
jgi:hypothetical protein